MSEIKDINVEPAIETPVQVEKTTTTETVSKQDTTKLENNKPGERKFNKNFSRDNKRKPRRFGSTDNFEEKIVKIKHISKTTKGGRRMRFSVLAIVGDKNGKIGFGIGKATEIPNAIKKALKNARKTITKVIINKRKTVYHEIIGHKGACKVLIKPAPEGTGIIAGGAIRAVVELAGYKDLYTKNLGSNTSHNMIYAVIDGLKKQLHPVAVRKARDQENKFIKKEVKENGK